jgi:outer membrane protein
MKSQRIGGYVLLLLTTGAICAQAWAGTDENNITIGVSGIDTVRYSGSDQHHWQYFPFLQVRQDAFFIDPQKGIGFDLPFDNGIYLENSLSYSFGRMAQDSVWRDGSNKLNGMGNIPGTVNTQLAIGWQVTDYLIPELRTIIPVTNSQGIQYQASLTLIPFQSKTDTLAFQQSLLAGDSRYINTFYGVSPNQSISSGYHTYQTHGGLYGFLSDITWQHQYTSHWATALSLDYTRLTSLAADSPIVMQPNNISTTLALSYTF